MYDNRKDSETHGEVQELILDGNTPMLLQIPPDVFHGWENIGKEEAFVVSIPNFLYDYKNPDEVKLDPFNNDIPFKWRAKKGG